MATTTPNFGWAVPTSTDLVKDGAVAIETLGDAIDASLVDLKGGTSGQVLAKASNTDMDFSWVTDAAGIPATILDAKGDIIAATAADTASRLGVGSNGQVLTADSAEATGLKWATPASGGATAAGTAVFLQTTLSVSNNTDTFIPWDSETFDTDGYHNNATNQDRFTVPAGKAGKYLMSASVQFQNNSSGVRSLSIAKNGSGGSNRLATYELTAMTGQMNLTLNFVVDAAVGDYYGFYVNQNCGTSLNLYGNSANTKATVATFMYLGA